MMFPRIKLALFQKYINLTMTRLFKAHGYEITREQEVILRELCQKDGVNQVDLAKRAGQDRNNLSRTLDILEMKKLVIRDVCHNDKRNSLVYVTPEGRALHAGAYEAVNEYRRILFQDFTQEEIEAFSTMIERMTGNLESYLEASKPDGEAVSKPPKTSPRRRPGGTAPPLERTARP